MKTDQERSSAETIPAINPGQLVGFRFNAVDFRTQPMRRLYRHAIVPGRVETPPAKRDTAWGEPTLATQFDWNPPKPGDYTVFVQFIDRDLNYSVPARVALRVISQVDSRTILDCNGAESLLGMGDMLFLPPGTAKLIRSHGAFVSDAEVQRVVDFLKKQGKPVYEKSILEMKESDGKGGGSDEEEEDPQYDAALALVAEARQASISMIQRRLRIGYNRAARIIEKMEQEGVVGPSDGTSKPREVFINKL